MSHRSALCRVAALSLLGVAAGAADARASTYCVADPACVAAGGHDSGADLGDGLADAAAHAGNDKVKVGPGTFTGPFAYVPPGDLELVGAGADATVLHLPPGAAGETLLTLSKSSVASLRLAVGAGNGNTGLTLVRGVATDIAVDFAAGSTSSAGVRIDGGLLQDARVVTPAEINSYAVVAGDLPYQISRADLRSQHGIVSQSPLFPSHVDRTRIHARVGIVHNCGQLVVDDVLVRGPELVHGVWGRDLTCPGDTRLTLRHATVAGSGAAGVLAQGWGAGNDVEVRVANSIISGVKYGLSRHAGEGARAALIADWSSWEPAGVVSENLTGGTGTLVAGVRVAGAPGFVDPGADDFRLRADSPLVDAGEPAALQPGEPITDLAGRLRLAPGKFGAAARRDLGAYERQPLLAMPTPAPPAGPVSAPAPAGPAPVPGPVPDGAATSVALQLSGARRQRALRSGVTLVARSDSAVRLRTTARLRLGRRTLRLPAGSAAVAAGGSSPLVVRLPARRRAAAKRTLLAGKRVAVTVRVSATAADGRTAEASRVVRVIGARAAARPKTVEASRVAKVSMGMKAVVR
jgi:hypothetical protein